MPRSAIAPKIPFTTAEDDCSVATAKYIVEPEVLITMWFGPVEKTVVSLSGSVSTRQPFTVVLAAWGPSDRALLPTWLYGGKSAATSRSACSHE